MNTTKDVIVRLLRNLGSRKEVEQYLKQYSSVDSQKFAVIKVGDDVLAEDLDALASSLAFLQRVGLQPIVLHGAGRGLDAALAEDGLRLERVDGDPVITPRVLEIVRRLLQRESLRLVEALEELGTHARPITAGVFEASLADEPRLGLLGKIQHIYLDAIQSSIRAGALPILASLGETPGGQIVYVTPAAAASELALSIQPYKVVFLTESGGLLDAHGRVVSAVNLAEDWPTLAEQPWIEPGMRRRLEEIRRILEALPPSSSVSITSPDHVARELFTHTGSGTLVRLGERVLRHESLDTVDPDRLRALLEACFQRKLTDDYFSKKAFYRIYLAESYRATAVLTRDAPVPYLDKFAVTAEAQGAGVGGSLWTRMKNENPKLFWRARNENEVNPWYFQQAQGSFRDARWTVFWYGLEGWEEIRACVEHALALPATLRQHGTTEG